MPAFKSKYFLSDLAARFELALNGDGSELIEGVSTLGEAGPTRITFLANRTYKNHLPALPTPRLRRKSGPLAGTGRTGKKNHTIESEMGKQTDHGK